MLGSPKRSVRGLKWCLSLGQEKMQCWKETSSEPQAHRAPVYWVRQWFTRSRDTMAKMCGGKRGDVVEVASRQALVGHPREAAVVAYSDFQVSQAARSILR